VAADIGGLRGPFLRSYRGAPLGLLADRAIGQPENCARRLDRLSPSQMVRHMLIYLTYFALSVPRALLLSCDDAVAVTDPPFQGIVAPSQRYSRANRASTKSAIGTRTWRWAARLSRLAFSRASGRGFTDGHCGARHRSAKIRAPESLPRGWRRSTLSSFATARTLSQPVRLTRPSTLSSFNRFAPTSFLLLHTGNLGF
jgi:hypothetical protein